MSSIQLFRTSTGRHPYMSRWSRNEPAACRMYLGNCDHWSKLKHRAAILTLKYGDGDTGIAFWSDNEPAENTEIARGQLLQREHQQNNKRLSSIGNKTFTETMIHCLSGEKPGHNTASRDCRKNILRSSANDRAREGFRYWVLEKPIPKGGKYTTGARTSVLGLGKSFYP
ncbi:uncharacterized protein LOC114519151 isoform X1 [Dendronephthya gigantea]|uniref:uncharacterized protein LOC114519151 isoform X1 n=1 Tax=Dendronephthya gigantea TaxID=151771 RepID=UPI00106B5C65|nr:uncharacterized protein LOC114519151 isoform X1 [Dendronephthya gigantea]